MDDTTTIVVWLLKHTTSHELFTAIWRPNCELCDVDFHEIERLSWESMMSQYHVSHLQLRKH